MKHNSFQSMDSRETFVTFAPRAQTNNRHAAEPPPQPYRTSILSTKQSPASWFTSRAAIFRCKTGLTGSEFEALSSTAGPLLRSRPRAKVSYFQFDGSSYDRPVLLCRWDHEPLRCWGGIIYPPRQPVLRRLRRDFLGGPSSGRQ